MHSLLNIALDYAFSHAYEVIILVVIVPLFVLSIMNARERLK